MRRRIESTMYINYSYPCQENPRFFFEEMCHNGNNHWRIAVITNDKIDVLIINFMVFCVRNDYHMVCNCGFGLGYNNFSIVYRAEIVIKHALPGIQLCVWKFFSHTPIIKQRLLLETASASFPRMSTIVDFAVMRCRTAFYSYCSFFSEDDDDYSDDDDMSWKVKNNALLTCEIELYSSRKFGTVW